MTTRTRLTGMAIPLAAIAVLSMPSAALGSTTEEMVLHSSSRGEKYHRTDWRTRWPDGRGRGKIRRINVTVAYQVSKAVLPYEHTLGVLEVRNFGTGRWEKMGDLPSNKRSVTYAVGAGKAYLRNGIIMLRVRSGHRTDLIMITKYSKVVAIR